MLKGEVHVRNFSLQFHSAALAEKLCKKDKVNFGAGGRVELKFLPYNVYNEETFNEDNVGEASLQAQELDMNNSLQSQDVGMHPSFGALEGEGSFTASTPCKSKFSVLCWCHIVTRNALQAMASWLCP